MQDSADGPQIRRVWELVAARPPTRALAIQNETAAVVAVLAGLAIAQTLDRANQSGIVNPVKTSLRPSWSFLGAHADRPGDIPIDTFETTIGRSTISPALARLTTSILTTLKSTAWSHLRSRLGMTPRTTSKPTVFVSYRRGREKFAEAVANRLGREGFYPWFDVWDVRPGDSLPGQIGKALEESVAFIPILTADYSEGVWATSEYETALMRAIPGDLRIVPLLLEAGPKPALLERYVHVDFTDQNPETFERRMGDVVDGTQSVRRIHFGSLAARWLNGSRSRWTTESDAPPQWS